MSDQSNSNPSAESQTPPILPPPTEVEFFCGIACWNDAAGKRHRMWDKEYRALWQAQEEERAAATLAAAAEGASDPAAQLASDPQHIGQSDQPEPELEPEFDAAHAEVPESPSHTMHPAGRGWIAVSRDIGLPGESAGDAQAAFAAGAVDDALPLAGAEADGEATGAPLSAVPCGREPGGEEDWVPACAGKTKEGAGMTKEGDRVPEGDPGLLADAGVSDWGADGARHHPQIRWSSIPNPDPGHLAFSHARRVRFAEHLAETGNVRLACAATGISRHTAYKARRRDETFAQAWDAALVLAARHAEAVLADRALEGVEEPVWFRGELVGHRRRYDTRLLLAHLGRLDARCARQEENLAAGRFDELLARLGGMEIDPDLGEDAADEGWVTEGERRVRVPGLALPRDEWLRHAGRAAQKAAAAQARAEKLTGKVREELIDELCDAAQVAAEDRWDAHRAAAFAWVDALASDVAAGSGMVAEEGTEPPLEYKSMDAALWRGADAYALDCVTPVTPWPITPCGLAPEGGAGSAFQQGELDLPVAGGDEADLAGGGFGYIDQTAAGEGAAIVDAHDHRLAAARVGDADLAAEGQGAVGGGQSGGVEAFAAGGAATGEFAAVVAGHADAELLALGLDGGERFGLVAPVLGDCGRRANIGQAQNFGILRAGRGGQRCGGEGKRAEQRQQARVAACLEHGLQPSVPSQVRHAV